MRQWKCDGFGTGPAVRAGIHLGQGDGANDFAFASENRGDALCESPSVRGSRLVLAGGVEDDAPFGRIDQAACAVGDVQVH